MMITVKQDKEYNACQITVNMKKTYEIQKIGEDLIRVCCKNAAHSSFRAMGKYFSTFEEAIKAYKSQAAKEAIKHAKEILK